MGKNQKTKTKRINYTNSHSMSQALIKTYDKGKKEDIYDEKVKKQGD